MRALTPCLLTAAFLTATSAAAGTFAPPEGCTAHLTVQMRGCLASHFYTCEGDAAGDQWRADYGANGPFYLSRINQQTEWVESYELDPPMKETLDTNPKDRANFDELLTAGLDSFDFGLTKADGTKTRVTGFDKLTGREVVIDGVTLKESEYEYTQAAEDGTVLRHSRGHEYVSPKWRTFLSGKSEWEMEDGSWVASDNSPVKFIEPGEPGFGNTIPLFECDDQMSQLEALPHSHGGS
ncbi:hypothetical protein NX862_05280 [Rhodobacter sp. KR11]|uniref:hypothetical protein n=1 Tax=Rhodobacter sp. KR11 TaxID=2974588 RepID=UPI002223E5C6|nr:hypothetical protein [Rhodobacter sp. KR11]MCW1918159.1 hypothetical protein [Rhodobacter sp. KR11]